MILVIGIGIGNPGKQILIGFTGEQIAVPQRFLAKIGKQIVAAFILRDLEAALFHTAAVALGLQFLFVIGLGRRRLCSSLPAYLRLACRLCVFGFAFWRVQYFRAHFTLTHICSRHILIVAVVSKIHQSPL